MKSVGQKASSKLGLLVLGFVALAIANGSRQGYGVFLPALVKELGSSNASLAGAFSIIHLINGFLAPLVGRSIDRYHPRPIFLAGTFLVSFAFLMLGFLKEVWHIYIIIGMILAPGISCIGLTAVNTMISRNFSSGRGTALGVVAMGSGVGTFFFLLFSSYLISRVGWRGAFWIWGGIQLVFFLPLVIKVLTVPRSVEQKETYLTVQQIHSTPLQWRGKTFSMLFFSVIMFTMANFIYLMYAVVFAQSKGISFVQAGQALSVVGITNALGSFALASMSDLFHQRVKGLVLAIGLVLVSLAVLVLFPVTYPLLIVSSIFFGLGMGGYYPLLPALVGELFDHKQIGTIYGYTLLAGGIGAFVGPVMGGWMYDYSNSYTATILIALVLGLGAIGTALVLLMSNLRKEGISHDHVDKRSH